MLLAQETKGVFPIYDQENTKKKIGEIGWEFKSNLNIVFLNYIEHTTVEAYQQIMKELFGSTGIISQLQTDFETKLALIITIDEWENPTVMTQLQHSKLLQLKYMPRNVSIVRNESTRKETDMWIPIFIDMISQLQKRLPFRIIEGELSLQRSQNTEEAIKQVISHRESQQTYPLTNSAVTTPLRK
jgi:hypothetical protein